MSLDFFVGAFPIPPLPWHTWDSPEQEEALFFPELATSETGAVGDSG